MNSFRKHWKPIIFTISIVLFALTFSLLIIDKISVFDDYIYKIVTYYKNDYLTYFFRFISFLCSTWFILLISAILMLHMKDKKIVYYVCLNLLLCVLLNQSLKFLIGRERPIGINLIFENGYSFPSGHSMISLAYYGFFIYVIAHKKWSKEKRLCCMLALSLLVLLVGISRIYLGVHYASDVLAGFALSMAYLIIFIKVFYKRIKNSF